MQIIFLGTNIDIIDELKKRHSIQGSLSFYTIESLLEYLNGEDSKNIVIADYDSIASQINKMISSNHIINNLIVLEKTPEVITGKMLISRHISAYGNSRMLPLHFEQMIKTVAKGKVWTYPELTAALVKHSQTDLLSIEALELINKRLTDKEKSVLSYVLQGLTNDAIASTLSITTRTVKAHMSAILSKLHVNDRLGLVLLLK